MIEVGAEHQLARRGIRAGDGGDHDVHEERLETGAPHLAAQHDLASGGEQVAQLRPLAAGEVEPEGDALQLVRARPHPRVLEHVGVLPGAIVVQETHDAQRSVLEHGEAVDAAAVSRRQHELAAHVLPFIVPIPRPPSHPDQLRRHVARVRVRDDAHRDLGVADDALVVRLDHPQLGAGDVPAGRGLPRLIDGAPVGRIRLDHGVPLGEPGALELTQHVLRRVPEAARALDAVMAGDLDDVLLRQLTRQRLVEQVAP
jgi:hypothetical protein